MELFCTKCKRITPCKITTRNKVIPTVDNGKFEYDKTTKCNICTTDTVHYKPL